MRKITWSWRRSGDAAACAALIDDRQILLRGMTGRRAEDAQKEALWAGVE
ncbi:hypothetical protein [Bradyrhizobium sp. CB3481]|nr:hypothetical protein [Bradyrhizobium sp. CB3481]WFU15373.1 hypothetical protein QA643_30995 [Bradyrhizobium sp. CB3481]